jgi:hypothetical protein
VEPTQPLCLPPEPKKLMGYKIMNKRTDLQIADTSIDWPFEQVRDTGKRLWTGILEGLTAWRERRAAAVLYAELSKLSNAELERRGIIPGDLHRQVSETSRQR